MSDVDCGSPRRHVLRHSISARCGVEHVVCSMLCETCNGGVMWNGVT